jgi:predicted nucleic acid-binding protein
MDSRQVPTVSQLRALEDDAEYQRLGLGEREAIALARECLPSVLLVSDNQPRRIALRAGVSVVNIPAFLLACKQSGIVRQTELLAMITDLQTKDFYGFRKDVLDLLTS